MNSKFTLFLLSVFSFSSLLSAGTLIFKDGSKVTDVNIVSINEGRIVVEKDKATKIYSLSQITSFYQTNLKGGDDGGPEGEFADYDVSISNVKMPGSGFEKSSDKDKDGKVSKCEVTFSVKRKGDQSETKKVRAPYFCLYVLTHADKEYGGRVIYRYTFPKEFKPKGRSYDKAAILETLSSFDRPAMHFDRSTSLEHGSGVGKNFTKGFNDRTAEFELKDLKNRKVLAYYLEVWGDSDIVATKDWDESGIKPGSRWWERYSGGKPIN